ncbi:hypothetical protein [Terriglobus aquaticus]|uniref:Uncharacterized protein n=1 Tax=Terriglobus aquaticus TaxID=940139 RepID=A0ABW9KN42_9BACT|nr:hypothetical protein [Terriglobus aquaticus]
MKRTLAALLVAVAATAPALAEKLIPAGSIIQCTISEPKVSSKTLDRGDPVLCRLSHMEYYGRSVFPYGAYLEGRFVDYKDPGHLVGKGWMELDFDKLVINQTDDVIPISAKVVALPNSKMPVDKEGKIHGTGHPVKDTVEWMIPVLWPIDLINLPRRGPTPTLKAEQRLTLKVMDDFGIPTKDEIQQELHPNGPALIPRADYAAPIERQPAYYAPSAQTYAPPVYQQPQQTAPTTVIYNNVYGSQQQPYYQQPRPQVVRVPQPYPVRVPYPVYPPVVAVGPPPPPPGYYGY